MANTITKQTLNDGERNLVVKVTIAGEGSGSDEASTVLIDSSTFSGAPTNLRLDRIEANLIGFSATLEWDADANVDMIHIPADEPFREDYRAFGGLQNAGGTGVTGDINITTTGLTVAADLGHMTLWLRKS